MKQRAMTVFRELYKIKRQTYKQKPEWSNDDRTVLLACYFLGCDAPSLLGKKHPQNLDTPKQNLDTWKRNQKRYTRTCSYSPP